MPWWWSQSKDGIGYKIFDGSSAHFHWIAHLGVRYLKRYTYIWEWTRLFQIPEVAFLVAQGTHVENGAIGFTYLLSVQRKMVSTKISHPDSKSTQNMKISHSCMISGKHSLLCNCLCFGFHEANLLVCSKFSNFFQIVSNPMAYVCSCQCPNVKHTSSTRKSYWFSSENKTFSF